MLVYDPYKTQSYSIVSCKMNISSRDVKAVWADNNEQIKLDTLGNKHMVLTVRFVGDYFSTRLTTSTIKSPSNQEILLSQLETSWTQG